MPAVVPNDNEASPEAFEVALRQLREDLLAEFGPELQFACEAVYDDCEWPRRLVIITPGGAKAHKLLWPLNHQPRYLFAATLEGRSEALEAARGLRVSSEMPEVVREHGEPTVVKCPHCEMLHPALVVQDGDTVRECVAMGCRALAHR